MTNKPDVGITPEMALTIHKFLVYSFEPVDFEWEGLTPQEKALVGREEFEQLVEWIHERGN